MACALPLAAAGPASAGEDETAREDCLAHPALVAYLDAAFNESRVAVAELDNGHAAELFTSPRGTWTLVERMPDGRGCINASGEHLQVENGGLGQRRPSS